VHGFVYFDPVLYGIFCGLEETRLGLVIRFVFVLFAEFVEFSNSDPLFLDTLLPHFQVLVALLLLSFALFLFFLHAEDLH
jgi:hypothetical protein